MLNDGKRVSWLGVAIFACSVLANHAWSVGAFDRAIGKLDEAKAHANAASQASMSGNAEQYQNHIKGRELSLDKACRIFQGAIDDDPNDTRMMAYYAEALALQGNYDLASELLEKAVRIVPTNAELWRKLGQARLETGRNQRDAAEKALKKAIELSEENEVRSKACSVLGDLYERDGLYELAMEQYQKAYSIDGSATVSIACIELRYGNVREATRLLESSGDEVTPEQAFLMQTRLPKALASFDRRGNWFPDTAEDHYSYAKLLVRVGRYTDAILPLERSLRLDPDQYTALNMLGGIKRSLGNVAGAVTAYQKSLELKADQPRTIEVLKATQSGE